MKVVLSDFMKQGLRFDLMPGTKILRRCSVCCGRHFDGCGELFLEEKKIADDVCLLNYTSICSQLSTSSTMSKNWMPTFVYQRRRDHKNSVPKLASSAISSEAPPLAAEEHAISIPENATEGVRSPPVHLVENNKVATTSSNGFRAVEEAVSEEAMTTDLERVLNDCSANDHCSSSKSNLELSSAVLKVNTDDAGECSSSAALIAQKAPAEISERDVCISILRSYGLLDRVGVGRDRVSNGNTGLSSNNYCSKSCKVCKVTESSKSMIICDNCDDAFHTYCYTPRITILPVSEWLCSSCLKKKHKILKDKSTSSNLVNISSGSGKDQNSSSEIELGSLEFMFRDTEPYMSNSRIGDEFQADVPDWNGPINEYVLLFHLLSFCCVSTFFCGCVPLPQVFIFLGFMVLFRFSSFFIFCFLLKLNLDKT